MLQRFNDFPFLYNTAREIGWGVFRKDIRKALVTFIFQAAPIIKKHVPEENKDRVACGALRMIILIHILARVLKVPPNDKAAVPFAIMVSVVDDLTDEETKALSKGDIEKCFMSPNGRLVCNLLYKTAQNVKNIPKFEEGILKVAMVQNESKRQLNGGSGNLTKETLEELSFKKGGYTGQLLLYLLKSNPTEEEEKAFFNMFSIMQLIDDLEDCEEDKVKGQHTLVTEGYYTADDIRNLIIDVEKEWMKIYGIRALSMTNCAKLYHHMASIGHNTVCVWLEHRPYVKRVLIG